MKLRNSQVLHVEDHHQGPKSLLGPPSPDLQRDDGAKKVLVGPAGRSRGRSSALRSFLFMIKTKAQSKNCEVATGVAVAILFWLSSVVIHGWGDGHTPPDLSPSNQTDNEKRTQEPQLFAKLEEKMIKTTQTILNK